MKKTFKKQLVLFTAVMVMMIIAMVMPASAEDVTCEEPHSTAQLREIVYPATCTQKGYSVWYCDTCEKVIVGRPYEENVTKETGHNYEVSYVLEDGAYKRVRTCKNDMCQRAEGDLIEIVNSVAEDGNAKYYLVEYWNDYALPAADAADHADYFNAEFYVKEAPNTWVSVKYAEEQFFPVNLKSNVDATKPAGEVGYEIINDNGELKLYAKEGETLPRYSGLTPKRNKDMTHGSFTFKEWVPEISGSKMLCKAVFDSWDTNVTATFYNGNGETVYSKTVKYGEKVAYSAEHVYPSKDTDQYYSYTYTDWRLGKDGIKTFGIYDDVTLYYSSDVRPQFASALNSYKVQFEKDNEAIGTVAEGVQKDNSIRDVLLKAGITNPDKAFELPRDKQYIYKQVANKWQITKVNGKKVSSTVYINSDAFTLNRNIYVVDGESLSEITFKGQETITLAPVYTKVPVQYKFTVKIRTNYFAKEDVYDHNHGVVTSDILSKFLVTIKDGSGNILAQGTTNEQGECTLTTNYADTLIFSAQTKNNTKYYGEHTLSLRYSTDESIENILETGVSIAPRVTEEWLAGEKKCGCICHTVLSRFVIRIYNVIYRIFNIKYVCCDDLFATYGDLLAYSK